MKKILTLALAVIMTISCFAVATSAAEPQKLAIDMTTDIAVTPGAEAGDNKVTVNDLTSAYSTIADGKITMEYNGKGSTEQFARSIVQFKKQIPAATYKFMVIDIKYGDATLNHYKNGANTTGEFTPHIQVGYVESDINTTPVKWVVIDATTGAILTTSATPDAYMNDTFVVNNVKDKTIQMLITLPSSEAVGYNNYLNYFYINPYGWANGATNNVKVEISAINFYDVNPFLVNEDNENNEQNNDENNNNNSQTPAEPETDAPETTAAPETTKAPTTTEATDEASGCGGVIGGSALVVAAITITAVVIKKKKED